MDTHREECGSLSVVSVRWEVEEVGGGVKVKW